MEPTRWDNKGVSTVFSYGGDTRTRYCLRTDGRTIERRTKGYRLNSNGIWPEKLKKLFSTNRMHLSDLKWCIKKCSCFRCLFVVSNLARLSIFYYQRIFNDKAFFFPMAQNHFGQLFNFCISIKLFIHKVKKTSKFSVLGLYLFNKYQ